MNGENFSLPKKDKLRVQKRKCRTWWWHYETICPCCRKSWFSHTMRQAHFKAEMHMHDRHGGAFLSQGIWWERNLNQEIIPYVRL